VFTIVNTAWRDQLQRKKIKRKNRYGRTNYRLVAIPQAVRKAIDLWRARCPSPDTNALMFPGVQARARKPLATPIHPRTIGCGRACVCTRSRRDPEWHFTLRFKSSGGASLLHGKKEAHPTEMQAQLGHSDDSNHPGHLHPDYKPGSGKDGEPSHKPDTRLGWGG
jgi:hypothetical protein